MLLKTSRSKSEKQNNVINIAEGFLLWDLLKTKYFEIEKLQLWENYVHDADLKAYITRFKKQIENRVGTLEKILHKYSLNGPAPNIRGINTSSNTEVLQDAYIAQDTFMLIQEALGMLATGVKNATTNDEIRKLLKQMTIQVGKELDSFIKFLKLKGWIDTPPLYPNIPANVEERLDLAEAYSLWDHLTYRYDNFTQTEVFMEFAYDSDLKMLLKRGHGILKQQVKLLEKELLHFGLPLPKPTSEIISPPESTEILKDKEMYRTIWLGMQSALVVHYDAVKQSIINDRVRGIFLTLLKSEIDNLDQFVKYGKLKGWMHPTPNYTMGNN